MTPHLVLASAIFLTAAVPPDAVFTLYRNSVLDTSAREHVATFDTDQGAPYNQENCWTAQKLFQAQSGVTVTFWCEKGRFHE
jgi:hypothetical protein